MFAVAFLIAQLMASFLIIKTNQLTDFYMRGTLIVKRLIDIFPWHLNDFVLHNVILKLCFYVNVGEILRCLLTKLKNVI